MAQDMEGRLSSRKYTCVPVRGPCREALRQAAQQVAAGGQHLHGVSDEVQRGLGLDTRPLVRPWNGRKQSVDDERLSDSGSSALPVDSCGQPGGRVSWIMYFGMKTSHVSKVCSGIQQAEQLAADDGEGAQLTRQLGLSRLCKFTLDLSVGGPLGGNASAAAGKPNRASGRGTRKQERQAKEGAARQQQHKPMLPAVVVGDTDALAAPGDGVSCS